MTTVPDLRRKLAKMRIRHKKEENQLYKDIQKQYEQEFMVSLKRSIR